MTSSQIKFNNSIIANSAANGRDGDDSKWGGAAGTGGTASGGNLISITGNSGAVGGDTGWSDLGGTGGAGSSPRTQSKYYSTPRANGGVGTNNSGNDPAQKGQNASTGTTEHPMLGGGGGGGRRWNA